MSGLPDIARATVAARGMLPAGGVVVALTSGGADSVALLRLLAAGGLGPVAGLSALHVNHLLRGEAADADEAFVRALCEQLEVPLRVVRTDVAAYAEAEGLNLEDAGRRVRYRLAEEEVDLRCAALGVPAELGRIAVAHTFDDRLETFLTRVVTGAGPGGLRSIAAVRGRVVRPLIDARRADVVAYLGELGQAWREDATNLDTARQRAWVRHELLPLVERQNPAFAATAARTMEILAEEDAELARTAAAAAAHIVRAEEGALDFDGEALAALSRPIARRVVRDALSAVFPEASRLEFEHADALVTGAGEPGFARDLPFGLRAEVEYGRLRVSRRGSAPRSVAPGLLACPGTLNLGAAGSIEARLAPPGQIAPGPDRVSIDADAVTWPLLVDAVREGDRMRPLGMEGTKKLSDLLVDAKVPRRLRAARPVVRDGTRIVWLAGVHMADECRVRPETARVAELVWKRSDAGQGLSAD